MYISDYDNTPVVECIDRITYDIEACIMYLDVNGDDNTEYIIQGVKYDEYRKLAGEILLNGYLDLTEYKVETTY